MKTRHRIVFENAARMAALEDGVVDLVVTSPPYPMIEMWDGVFEAQDPAVRKALDAGDGTAAFGIMHRVLDAVWSEVYRVLGPGGIACVNIGDATRTIDGNFALYPNHARVLSALLKAGFQALPAVLWRKQTNAPNKFMGSGMMPPGAYVTLEHEYILVLRKGRKREFSRPTSRDNRRGSAFFWEERNTWFSDVWMDLKGARQNLADRGLRARSGAFPFELAYRLVNMFSVKGDHVLDPFAGTGTTLLGAMAAGRHSTGYEIDAAFEDGLREGVRDVARVANARIRERLAAHLDFVAERRALGKDPKHTNRHYGFPVVTGQERFLLLNALESVEIGPGPSFTVSYAEAPQAEFLCAQSGPPPEPPGAPGKPAPAGGRRPAPSRQRKLFG